MRGLIAGERGHLLLPVGVAQHLPQRLDGGLLQRRLQADQVVVLPRQRHEIETARTGGQFDAQAGIGRARRNGLRHGRVRGFRQRVARKVLRAQPGAGEKVVEQHPGARAQGPVDEARALARHIRQRAQAERVARRHHQTLRTPPEADDLVQAGLQQRPVGARGHGVGRGLGQGVKTRQDAAALIERGNRIHAAGEADVQVQIGLLRGMGTQGGQCVVVAGVERQHMGGRVEGHREGALQVGAQGFDLRAQARLCLALGPHQLGAKLRQPRRLAFFPDDQLVAEFILPALELAPDVAVGQAERARRRRDRALRVHGLQQVDQRVAHQRCAGVARECVVELDPMHGGTYRGELIGCLRYPIHADRPFPAPCPRFLKAPAPRCR